jgi:acyl carrier protein
MARLSTEFTMQATHDLAAPRATLQVEVIREIYRLLAPYQVGGRAITPQTVISKGLTVDSLTIMDMIMELEERFDVTIPMNVAADIVTIDQLAETVVALSTRR